MKRFYKEAEARAAEDGWEILLDGRPVKTPARGALILPNAGLAASVAAEWAAQSEEIAPRSMPFTGLANAAIDRVAADAENYVRSLTVYGETDLLCYRAEGPESLVAAQAAAWDPILAWARRRYDVDFEIVFGILHRAQPGETLARLGKAIATRDNFQLAAMTQLVTISGSLLIALALAEGGIDLDQAWAAASADEAWQAAHWGEDLDASRVLEARRQDFAAAFAFLGLL